MAQDRNIAWPRAAVAGVLGLTALVALTRAVYGAINRMRAAPEPEAAAPETTDEVGEVWVVVDEVWLT